MRWTKGLTGGAIVLFLAGVFLFDVGDLLEPDAFGIQRPELPFAVPPDGSGVVTAVGDRSDCESASVWNGIVSAFDGRLAWAGIREEVPREVRQTARLIERQPGIVLALGDIVYPEGELDDFRECFEPAWASLLPRTYPVPGNHEYKTGAAGYRAYWGARAGSEAGLFYSFDYAGWHMVGLNSEITGGPGSDQAAWLEADLAAYQGGCILAFYHRPAFTAVKRNGDENAAALFEILYRHGATRLLSGHNHFYERTAPLNPQAKVEEGRGLRQFVVGTGGHGVEHVVAKADFTEALVEDRWGALRLTLEEGGYAWAFLETPDGAIGDSGRGTCVSRS
jgi:hypothetical protein